MPSGNQGRASRLITRMCIYFYLLRLNYLNQMIQHMAQVEKVIHTRGKLKRIVRETDLIEFLAAAWNPNICFGCQYKVNQKTNLMHFTNIIVAPSNHGHGHLDIWPGLSVGMCCRKQCLFWSEAVSQMGCKYFISLKSCPDANIRTSTFSLSATTRNVALN